MRRKLTAIIAGAMMVGNAVAASDVKITPMFDVSYMHSDVNVASGDVSQNEGLGDPNSRDEIEVVYAGLNFAGSSKNLDWTLDANFAGDANYATDTFINQAVLKYSINDNFSVSAGRFYSFLGSESALNKGNWNYTKSIAKIIAPIFHEGISAAWDAKNGFTVAGFVVDGNLNNEDSGGGSVSTEANSAKKGYGATVGYAVDKLTVEADYLTTSYTVSGEATTHYAFNGTYNVNDQFAAGLTAQMGSGEPQTEGQEIKYTSYAGYLKFKATEKFYAALRYELFSEEKDVATDDFFSNSTNFSAGDPATKKENDVDSITLTAGYDFMNGSELKAEYRMDSSDEEIYTEGDGSTEDSNNTIALAWLFTY